MQYPLHLTFKVWAFAPQISIVDANEKLVFYTKQKLFKLKEAVTVFADVERKTPLYSIKANRIIDFSARYDFSDAQGISLGAVKRHGLKSLWRARYDVVDGETVVITIREKNPWVKVVDSLFSEIPFLGILSGYLFHPVYLVTRPDETVVMHLTKIPSFWSRKFTIKQVNLLTEREEQQALLSVLMLLWSERNRG